MFKHGRALLSILLVSIAVTSAAASVREVGEISEPAAGGMGVSSFLTREGRFDLDAARRIGFEGSVSLDGFEASFDPTDAGIRVQPMGRGRSRLGGEGSWWEGFGSPSILPGMDRFVLSMAVYQNDLIVGGCFTDAGGVPAAHIARWDGTRWYPLGSGFPNWVLALAVYEGELVAGSCATQVGRQNGINCIGRWDGSRWRAFGEEPNDGMDADVCALAVYRGDLIAGGWFHKAGGMPAERIARWDGERWHPLGAGMNGNVYALQVAGDDLVAGGDFTKAGDGRAARIARWDGSQWHAFGSGMSSSGGYCPNTEVRALALFQGMLIAGGWFEFAGGREAHNIALWTGAEWQPLGTGLDSWVRTLTVHQDRLVAAGWFRKAGEMPVQHIAAWDGSQWRSLGTGTDKWVYDAVVIWNGNLIAGGWFLRAGEVDAGHIAAWDGSQWGALEQLPPGRGANGSIHALLVHDGDLICGGEFSRVGGLNVRNIARWDGEEWHSMGAGFNGPVFALAEDGDLFAGGGFTRSGSAELRFISRWDGVEWEPLGSGPNAAVRALTRYKGDLAVGGDFDRIGASTLRRVAVWNGEDWAALGEGTDGTVLSLAEWDGRLYAGGYFGSAGGAAIARIASWDGAGWASVGGGVDGPVRALLSDGLSLVAAGNFRHAGSILTGGIARFDGSTWSALTSEPDLYDGLCLARYHGALIVGGTFDLNSSLAREFIGRLEDGAWQSIAGGTDGTVHALSVSGDDLFAGGAFRLAGENGSYRIARFTEEAPEAPEGGVEDPAVEPPPGSDPPPAEPPPPTFAAAGFTVANPHRAGQPIAIELLREGEVLLELFDPTGRRMGTLYRGRLGPGSHEIAWRDRLDGGSPLRAGVYFIRARLGDRSQTRTIILAR